jgi:hypothetical protein
MKGVLSLFSRSDSTSTESTPFPRYVGVTLPTRGAISSLRSKSEDKLRATKSDKSFTSEKEIRWEHLKHLNTLIDTFENKS